MICNALSWDGVLGRFPIRGRGIGPIGSVAFDYTLRVTGDGHPSPRPAIFHYGERVMHIFTLLFRLLVFQLGMLCLSLPCYAERAEPVQYHPIVGLSGGFNATAGFLGSGGQTFNLTLPAIQIDLAAPVGGMKTTGEVFLLPAPVTAAQLAWEPVAGGYVARVQVSAEQAKRLRLHVILLDGPTALQFRVQGNMDATPLGPVTPAATDGNALWLPVTDGNAATLEIFAGGANPPAATGLMLDAVNVIVADVTGGNAGGIVAKLLGYVNQPEYDFACFADNANYAGLAQAASATAKINFINNGKSYICSGTLLNDKGNTQTPWFATANHCLPTQAVADTVTFEWFFQATQCGGKTQDPRYAQTYGGAVLLYTDVTLEPSFLKLNRLPPSGVFLSGWDTRITAGEEVWGVHHPKGDHTMVSHGKVDALGKTIIDADTGTRHVLNVVTFDQGGIEKGSSGSGLFAIASGVAYWKGGVFGGPDDYQIGAYSDFPSYYSNIKQWLENTSTPTGTLSVTATPSFVTYPNPSVVRWAAPGATSCTVSINGSAPFAIPVSGSATVTPFVSTTYTISCTATAGTSSKAVKVSVNSLKMATCLLDWAEKTYPGLFSPAGTALQIASPYMYRYYPNTGAYLGISTVDMHLYSQGPDGVLQHQGNMVPWLIRAACL